MARTFRRKQGSRNQFRGPEPTGKPCVGAGYSRPTTPFCGAKSGMGDLTEMKSRKTVDIESAAPKGEMSDIRDAMGRPVGSRKTEVRLGREVQARIGQQLRSMYDQVV